MRTAISGLMLVIVASFFLAAAALAEGTLPPHWPAGTLGAARPAESLKKVDGTRPYMIKAINVVGNKLIPEAQIKALMKTKPGDAYDRGQLMSDLIAIDQLGCFVKEDLEIRSEVTSSGLVITVHVRENIPDKSLSSREVNSCPLKIGQAWPEGLEWPKVLLKKQPVAWTGRDDEQLINLFQALAKSADELTTMLRELPSGGSVKRRNVILGPNRYPSVPVGDFDKSFQPTGDACSMTVPESSDVFAKFN